MALEVGTRIGVYEVTGKLGEGGMGEVYRAHDTTLDRDVALKVLSEAFTADPDRLARFQREAKVLASLNHPNIGGIYGLEAAGESQALVLELIEGPTLADRIAEGAIPVDDALTIARQIAEALEAAHEQGIVHRDLKPANIKVRPDGTVKVLDFGLAKAVATDASGTSGTENPTISLTGATQMGMVIGTAAYMAPEQAKGKAVDKRADVWAFGVVLFEMLSGSKCFPGDDVSDTLATVLKSDPVWDVLPEGVPERVRQLLRTCLEKDPKQRIHDVADVRLAMGGAFETRVGPSLEPTEAPALRFWQRPVIVGAVALLALLAGGVSVLSLVGVGGGPVQGVTRLPLSLGPGESFSNSGRRVLAVSPDGRYMCYQANGQLFLRAMDQMEATPIRGTDTGGGIRSSIFSPDNQWIAFHQEGEIQKVAVTGGAPVTLADTRAPFGMSWGADDMILLGQGPAGIWRVPATGGVAEVVVTVEEGELAQSPELLPGGEWILFTLRPSAADTWSESQLVAQSLVTDERRVLINGGTDGHYLPTGHLVFAQEGTLLAVRFDVEAMEVTPGPVPLVEDVAMAGTNTGSAHYAVADSGMLAYVSDATLIVGNLETTLVRVGRDGLAEPITEVAGNAWYPRFSPNGSRIAFAIASAPGAAGDADLWVLDIERGTRTRLTFADNNRFYPVWSPDGTELAFAEGAGNTNRILRTQADGSGGTETLLDRDERQFPMSWAPDGSALAIYKATPETGRDLYILPLDGDGQPEPFLTTPFQDRGVSFSPNGQWLAYVSAEAGLDEIYVRPYPGPGGEVIVSNGGGQEAVWGPDGTELFYRNRNQMMVVGVETNEGFSAEAPRLLFEAAFVLDNAAGGGGNPNYDIAPDGESFVMVVGENSGTPDGAAAVPITVVLNWFEELQERVPVP